MSNYIIYEEFEPQEGNSDGKCIWCGKSLEKNKSHILSRKIVKKNCRYNLLKKTVCINCNSSIGSNIEDFLFKKTPLGYLADMFLHREFKTLKWIPNYYWSIALCTWVICIHDKNVGKDILPDQIMLNAENDLTTFLNSGENFGIKNQELIKRINLDLKDNNYTIHESSKYPDNFFTRAFYLNNKLILTGKDTLEIDKFKKAIQSSKPEEKFKISKTGSKLFANKYQINFKWDIKTYFDYCAKIAFEFFSLVAGREVCLEDGFNDLRSSILEKRVINPLEVTYTEEEGERVFSNKLVPEGWISYAEVNERISIFPLADTERNFNHSVFIYELDNGLVCATVKLFNIHLAQLILGKRNQASSFYSWAIRYNIFTSEMQFFKSIIDKEKIETLSTELTNKLPDGFKITHSPDLVWNNNLDERKHSQ